MFYKKISFQGVLNEFKSRSDKKRYKMSLCRGSLMILEESVIVFSRIFAKCKAIKYYSTLTTTIKVEERQLGVWKGWRESLESMKAY